MAKKPLPCPTLLRLLLDYNPETGKLFWKPRKPWMFPSGGRFSNEAKANQFNANFAYKEAFTSKNSKGYLVGSVRQKNYVAHRIIWSIATGCDPKSEIDHINRVKNDNRLENLRGASGRQNCANKGPLSKSRHSAFKGVCRNKRTGGWTAAVSVDGKQVHLGTFKTEIDAAKAYDQAAIKYHGEFAFRNSYQEHAQ